MKAGDDLTSSGWTVLRDIYVHGYVVPDRERCVRLGMNPRRPGALGRLIDVLHEKGYLARVRSGQTGLRLAPKAYAALGARPGTAHDDTATETEKEGAVIDTPKRAVKPSQSSTHEGRVLLRETDEFTNVQLHYTPQDALEVGRALVEVALSLGAVESPPVAKDELHRRMEALEALEALEATERLRRELEPEGRDTGLHRDSQG